MDKKERIRLAIEGLRGKSPEQAYNYLVNNCYGMPREEMSIAYTLGTYQPQIFLDGDLKKFLEEHRAKIGRPRGSLIEDLDEVSLIIKAYLSPQYRRYIKHMMISFVTPEAKIFPVEGKDIEECGICHKPLYQFSEWQGICNANPRFGEQDRKEYLSIGSESSNNSICSDCLVQLKSAYEILEYLNPGFLYEL